MTGSSVRRRAGAALGAIAALWASAGVEAQQATPLFADDAPLRLTIEAPFRELIRNADVSTDYYEGELRLGEPDDVDAPAFPIRVQARGLTRRTADICSFPPLRINFDRSERPLDGTVFEGQNRLKMVTHCQSSARYQQYYVLEHLAYRIYNELTPVSFRVRTLEVTYRDSEGRRRDETRFAFFIEDVDDLAERNGYEEYEVEDGVEDSQLDAELAALGALFQYMIGNLDWDFAAGPPGDDCCHNSRLLRRPGPAIDLAPAPYDFDYAGLVDAPYAIPPASLRVRSVTDRRYRGLCLVNSALPLAVARVYERRDAILALIRNETRLDSRTRRRAANYIESFYQIVGDARSYDRSIVQACQ